MNDLVNRIAEGKATLLGAEDICTRLGISRSTFDRWQKKNGTLSTVTSGAKALLKERPKNSLFNIAAAAGDDTPSTPFPPPDIRLGNSPKWELQTFKKWLLANVTTD